MERNANIDILKFTLSFMVIAIHSHLLIETSPTINHLLENGILRIAVPLFFIINGYYLFAFFNKNRLIGTWIKRVTELYLIWMIAYLPLYIPSALNAKSIYHFIVTLVFGYHHLWYIAGLFGSGLLLYYLKQKSDIVIFCLSLSLFAIGVTLQYASLYCTYENTTIQKILSNYWIYRNFLFFGFPFLSIGYLINKKDLATNISKKLLTIGILLSAFLIAIEIFINFDREPHTKSIDFYFTFIIFCPLTFILIANNKHKLKTDYLSKSASAIYFTHPFFIFLLKTQTPIQNGTLLF
ncbi:acyltransferase family protein [Methylomonas sp. EFPC1]|uniref:acyltransferase family protein n=1 Tax=Methylomonas sp. EFPC1 TaxID=2812647 RepID=UPI0023DDC003|nr:acyltransferase family protein [Methylomonas sp. EFPC1]